MRKGPASGQEPAKSVQIAQRTLAHLGTACRLLHDMGKQIPAKTQIKGRSHPDQNPGSQLLHRGNEQKNKPDTNGQKCQCIDTAA